MPIFQHGQWIYKPAWFCIYCSDGSIKEATKRKLQQEHIIPFGLGGNQVIPRSSCRLCGRNTGMVERQCQRMMLGPTRIRLNLPTRNPSQKPSMLTLFIAHKDGHSEERTVPASEFPLIIPGLRLPPPGVLVGARPHPDNVGEFFLKYPTEELRRLIANENEAVRLASFNSWLFARMLAKIAHSFAVAEWGYDSFDHFLPDLILGKTQTAFHYVGGDMSITTRDNNGLHRIFARREIIRGCEYVIVYLTLFCNFGMPEYRVVVGRWKGTQSNDSRCAPA